MSQSRIDFMRTMRLQETTPKPTPTPKPTKQTKKTMDADKSLFSEDEFDDAEEEEEAEAAEEAEESTSSDDDVAPSIAGSTTGSSFRGTKNFTKLGLNRGSSGIINHKI
jgi:hypothetical protein